MVDILDNLKKNIKEVCNYLNLDIDIFEKLVNHEKIIKVNFPVLMDNGNVKFFFWL